MDANEPIGYLLILPLQIEFFDKILNLFTTLEFFQTTDWLNHYGTFKHLGYAIVSWEVRFRDNSVFDPVSNGTVHSQGRYVMGYTKEQYTHNSFPATRRVCSE